MVEESTKSVRIDLNQFKLRLYLKPEVELTLHFDSPSRRFYLSVIALVVSEMKKQGRLISIPLKDHMDMIVLLNQTVGGAAGSSKKERLLPRIYRKWKDALPDLENAPLFNVVGRKKSYDDSFKRVHNFSEREKDSWANLFEYKGSHEHVRLRFSIDRLSASLDDVHIVYGDDSESANPDAWESFIADLKEKREGRTQSESKKDKVKALKPQWVRQKKWIKSMPGRWQLVMVCILIGIISGTFVFIFWKDSIFAPKFDVASIEKMAFPLPDKPSIAVLPFNNLSGDPEQDYFSDGLTEEIITALSKIDSMFVIAGNTSFTYKGKSVNVKQVAEDLGVHYVLEGSVRKAEDRMRISAQLIDALKGHHLWAERYDRKLEDIFALQDEITMNILTALQVNLTAGERLRVLLRNTDNLDAYQKYLKARVHYLRLNPDDNAIAKKLYEEAIALDPEFLGAIGDLAWTHLMDIPFGRSKSSKESYERAAQLAQRMISLDKSSAGAYVTLGQISMKKGQFKEAIAQAEKAVALGPGDSIQMGVLSGILFYAGRYEEALSLIKKTIRLDPIPLSWYIIIKGSCYLYLGRHEEAIEEFKKILHRNQNNLPARIRITAAYSLLGREEDANASASEVLRIIPNFSVNNYKKSHSFKNKKDLEQYTSALRKAGLPE
jgi:adenylate cyclase